MKRRRRTASLIGAAGIVLTILVVFPAEKMESATPTVKVPGPYPYETPVQVPLPPPVAESSPLPSPAPFPYPGSSSLVSAAQNQDSHSAAAARQVLTAKAVRQAAFKYNGVANFWAFLAALPADVGVFDPKLGTTRTLVKGGHVVRKNVAWLHKHKQTTAHVQNGS
jgi:hypothetical protein